jgi:uncharacterized protein YukE
MDEETKVDLKAVRALLEVANQDSAAIRGLLEELAAVLRPLAAKAKPTGLLSRMGR